MPSLNERQQRQKRKLSGRARSNTSPRRRRLIFWECVMRSYGIGLARVILSPSCPTRSGISLILGTRRKCVTFEMQKNTHTHMLIRVYACVRIHIYTHSCVYIQVCFYVLIKICARTRHVLSPNVSHPVT